MKIERQLKSKSSTKAQNYGSSCSWGSKWPKKEEKRKDKSNDYKEKSKGKGHPQKVPISGLMLLIHLLS